MIYYVEFAKSEDGVALLRFTDDKQYREILKIPSEDRCEFHDYVINACEFRGPHPIVIVKAESYFEAKDKALKLLSE